MIEPSLDAWFLNYVINDPSVFPWVSLGAEGPLDMTAAVMDPKNLFLKNEYGGFLLIDKGDQVFEIHTQFLPEGRGRKARTAAREAMQYVFTRTLCQMLVTHCPLDNKPSAWLALSAGMKFVGKAYPLGVEADMYVITKDEWQCPQQQ